MAPPQTPIVGRYPVSLTVGTHSPGAQPCPSTCSFTRPPGQLPDRKRSKIPVTKIHGKLVHVGPHIVVNLEGTGIHTFPPPAIGTAEGPVEIHLVVYDKYFGPGVKDVPVKPTH